VTPDDPRHASTAGYNAGCRELCCRRAAARYERRRTIRRYINRGGLLVPGTGTRRRLQALVALGWSTHALEAELGQKRSYVSRLITADSDVHAATAEKVAALYDRLSMTIPPAKTAKRVRNYAAKQGWVPPLAWDDIDNDSEPANALHAGPNIDPVVVMRLLEGQRINATKAEKEATIERWVADGGSERELCAWHGWKPGRYSAGLRLVRGGAA
jgi:hypothetical protein